MRGLAWMMVLLAGCEPALKGTVDEPGTAGPEARFQLGGEFWASPFPSDHRVDAETRRVRVAAYPNPGAIPFLDTLVELLDDQVQGWSQTGAVYIPFDQPVSPDLLPTLAESTGEDALAFLQDVDEESPTRGERYPVDIRVFEQTAAGFGPEHAVVALPLQGVVLPPRTRFAMVVQWQLRDADGRALVTPAPLQALFRGERPGGWRDDVASQYLDAVRVLREDGVDTEDVAGLTVFTTSRATPELFEVYEAARAEGGLSVGRLPQIEDTEIYDDYCVLTGTFSAPVFQEGEPPYSDGGGGFVFEGGDPVFQRTERGRFIITLPRALPQKGDRKTVVFIRTGGGGNRPLVDRGIRTTPGEDVPGTGFAREFARRGWTGVQLDGPLGGLRNPDGSDEQFLIFNVANPRAMRDNLRQSAIELALVPELLEDLRMPHNCPGLPQDASGFLTFDAEELVLFGHSMGATIAPLTLALQPRYRAAILSGAGGSWIENVIHKQSPIPVKPLAATLIEEVEDDLTRFHPVLNLLQWAGEPADPPLYADRLGAGADDLLEIPHVLMLQGVSDTYIPPPVANAMSLSMRLDLAGEAEDAVQADTFRPLTRLLPYSGGRTIPLPAGGNQSFGEVVTTRVVVQHPEDGVEDGHEVAYQVPLARHQVACFVETVDSEDVPVVAATGQPGDPCPLGPGSDE